MSDDPKTQHLFCHYRCDELQVYVRDDEEALSICWQGQSGGEKIGEFTTDGERYEVRVLWSEPPDRDRAVHRYTAHAIEAAVGFCFVTLRAYRRDVSPMLGRPSQHALSLLDGAFELTHDRLPGHTAAAKAVLKGKETTND